MTKYTTPHHNWYFFMSQGDSCGRHAAEQTRTGVGGKQWPRRGQFTTAFRTKKRVVHTTIDHFWHTTHTTANLPSRPQFGTRQWQSALVAGLIRASAQTLPGLLPTIRMLGRHPGSCEFQHAQGCRAGVPQWLPIYWPADPSVCCRRAPGAHAALRAPRQSLCQGVGWRA